MCFSRLLYELAGFRHPYWNIFSKGVDLYKVIVLSLAAMSGGLAFSKIIMLGHDVLGNIIWDMTRYSNFCMNRFTNTINKLLNCYK